VGPKPNWAELEEAAQHTPPGCDGTPVLPFVNPEPSLGISQKDAQLRWIPQVPESMGTRFRASLEAIAYLIALAIQEHEDAGQRIARITVSGGIARSNLMCEILATVSKRPLLRLESEEGPALGAAVTALAALESHLRKAKGIRKRFTVADAVTAMVRFRGTVEPRPEWMEAYQQGMNRFREALGRLKG
jgi:sugar (pentulose or hexulose) kinase